MATDDPEGAEVYQALLDCREERIIILSHQDTALVNALQRQAAVVVHALCKRLGRAARETVQEKFLLSRLLEQYLDLFNSFETIYRLPYPEGKRG